MDAKINLNLSTWEEIKEIFLNTYVFQKYRMEASLHDKEYNFFDVNQSLQLLEREKGIEPSA